MAYPGVGEVGDLPILRREKKFGEIWKVKEKIKGKEKKGEGARREIEGERGEG